MRDIAITILVFGLLPFVLRRPHIGVLVWSWLSYMNPHKLAFGFAYSMPFAQIVAITLFASLLFTREKLRLPATSLVVVWIIFIIWMVFTTWFAIYPDDANLQLIKVIKIQVMTLLTLVLITNQQRVNQLIWVIVFSIGFYSTKGGVFTVSTGGSFRVWGPARTFIEENNSLALATLMIIPLMIYLYRVHRDIAWLKFGLAAASALSIVSVFGSLSRGALVGALAVGAFFWAKSRQKLLSGIAIMLTGVMLFSFMPESWHERMDTISSYQEDASAMGRINAWWYSVNVASERVTGAGFESWKLDTFARWAPNPQSVAAAHSIYFSVLADHGWFGFFLYGAILFLAWRNLAKVIHLSNDHAHYSDQNFLARMLQVSLVAYMSGGAFLSLSYFDLPWHIVAITVVLRQQIEKLEAASTDKVRLVRTFHAS